MRTVCRLFLAALAAAPMFVPMACGDRPAKPPPTVSARRFVEPVYRLPARLNAVESEEPEPPLDNDAERVNRTTWNRLGHGRLPR